MLNSKIERPTSSLFKKLTKVVAATTIISFMAFTTPKAMAMQTVSDEQLAEQVGEGTYRTGACTAYYEYCGNTPVIRNPGDRHPICIGEDCGTGDDSLAGNDNNTYYSDITYPIKFCPSLTNDPNLANCKRGKYIRALARQIYLDAFGNTTDGVPHTMCEKQNCINY